MLFRVGNPKEKGWWIEVEEKLRGVRVDDR